MDPEFYHTDAENLPVWITEGWHDKPIAGEISEHSSSVPVFSRLFMLEIKSVSRQTFRVGPQLFGEAGLYILSGSTESDENTDTSKQ